MTCSETRWLTRHPITPMGKEGQNTEALGVTRPRPFLCPRSLRLTWGSALVKVRPEKDAVVNNERNHTMTSALILMSLVLLVGWGSVPPAEAKKGTITQKFAVGCISEDALDEYTGAILDRDMDQVKALLQSAQCFLITGRKYSTIDVGFVTTTIRVYAGGGSIVLIVPTEYVH